MTDLNEKALEAAADALYGTAGFSGRVASLDKQQAHFTAMLAIRAYLASAGGGVEAVSFPNVSVDDLAQIIRRADGDNRLGAGALAEAILSALVPHETPSGETQAGLSSTGETEPYAWEGYWAGAGSINSQTSITRHEPTMRRWEADGAEITPLYLSALSHPVVPEGWRMVPVEPTQEMVKAGARRVSYESPQMARNCFEAMLAAAPKPEGE